MFISQKQNFSQRHLVFSQPLAFPHPSVLPGADFNPEPWCLKPAASLSLSCLKGESYLEDVILFFQRFHGRLCPRATLSCVECREAEQFCHARKMLSVPWDTRSLLTVDFYFFALFSPCGILASPGDSCSETSSWASMLPPNTTASLCWSQSSWRTHNFCVPCIYHLQQTAQPLLVGSIQGTANLTSAPQPGLTFWNPPVLFIKMTTQEISSFPHWKLKVKSHHSCCRGFTKSHISSFCFKNTFFFLLSHTDAAAVFGRAFSVADLPFSLTFHQKNPGLSTPQDWVSETLKVKVKYITASGKALLQPRSSILHF